jgi:hypothetical protein
MEVEAVMVDMLGMEGLNDEYDCSRFVAEMAFF